jgi:hypothetical protein
MDMIAKANWRTGVLSESQRQLADAWGWTQPRVHRFLIKLERDCMIQNIHADYCLLDLRPELEPGEVFPGIVIPKTYRLPNHLAISNYFKFQQVRIAERIAERITHNNKDYYLFPYAVSFPKETKDMSAVEVQPDLIPPPKKKTYRERDPVALHLASFLVAAIKRTDNGDFPHKPRIPRDVALGSKGWASTLRLMMTNDGHTADEIKKTILWLYGKNLRSETPFVVMSPKSLRAKWDRIQLQRKRKDQFI